MPQLQFDFNKNLTGNQKDELCSFVSALFSQVMQTGTDHIGILIREHPQKNLYLGQVSDKSAGILFTLSDIKVVAKVLGNLLVVEGNCIWALSKMLVHSHRPKIYE